jgi:hypothetical protein
LIVGGYRQLLGRCNTVVQTFSRLLRTTCFPPCQLYKSETKPTSIGSMCFSIRDATAINVLVRASFELKFRFISLHSWIAWSSSLRRHDGCRKMPFILSKLPFITVLLSLSSRDYSSLCQFSVVIFTTVSDSASNHLIYGK